MAYLPTIFEQRWPGVILTGISVANYIITVSDTAGLHPKQKIALSAIGQTTTNYTIQRVLSNTQIQVVPWYETPVGAGQDQSLQNPTQFNGGTLTASEDVRNKIGYDIVLRAVYDNEPSTALRNVLVNKYGAYYDAENPLPVAFDGTVEIGNVSVVQGGNTMTVNSNGSINTVDIASLVKVEFDDIKLTNSTIAGFVVPTLIQYLVGGPTGTEVARLVLTYDVGANLTNVQYTEP